MNSIQCVCKLRNLRLFLKFLNYIFKNIWNICDTINLTWDCSHFTVLELEVSPLFLYHCNKVVRGIMFLTSISQSVCQSVSPSVCQSVCLSVSPSVSLSVSQSVSPSVCQSVSPLVCQSVRQSISLSVSLSVSQSVNPSVSQSVHQSVCQLVSPSICQSVCQSCIFVSATSLKLKHGILWNFGI